MGDLGAQCDWLPLSGRVRRQNPSGPAIPRLCLVPALASSTACATWDRVSGLRLAGENVLQACHENGVHSLQHFLCSKTPGEHAICSRPTETSHEAPAVLYTSMFRVLFQGFTI